MAGRKRIPSASTMPFCFGCGRKGVVTTNSLCDECARAEQEAGS